MLEEIINEVSSTTMRNALHAHNERKRELEDRANKRIGEIFKKNGIKGNTYGATTPDDIERAVRTEKEIQNDSEMKNIQKEQEKRARKNKLYVDALNKIHRAKLAESQELSELFDRPDLLDDISKALTNKTIKQHLQDQAKKLLGGKKKKKDIKENFDSLEENSYNIVKLLEEVINEISDKKCREPLEKLENKIGALEEIEKNVESDENKKKLDDIIIPDEHRLNVSQEKFEKRIAKRAEDEYKKSKKKKRK